MTRPQESFWIALTACLALGCGLTELELQVAEWDDPVSDEPAIVLAAPEDQDFVEVALQGQPLTFAGGPPLPVFLNRHGGTYSAGSDDSRVNRSSVLQAKGISSVHIPAWAYGDARWNQVVECVKQRMSAFNVTVTDAEPSGGVYQEIVVGGSGAGTGYQGWGGVAPMACDIVPRAVGYVFPANLASGNAEYTCKSILHELGHTLSLDHAYWCKDPMTYLDGCGSKTWQNANAQCGENSTRGCSCGRSSQNSVQILTAKLGLKDGPTGGPVANGQLIQGQGDPKVYVVHRGKKHHIVSEKVLLSHGYSWPQVRKITMARLNSGATGQPLRYREGSLVRDAAGKIYVIDQAGELGNATWRRRWITSAAVFNACGFNWSDVVDDHTVTQAPYQSGANVTTCASGKRTDGQLIKAPSGAIYRVETSATGKVQRRHVKSADAFDSHKLRWDRVISVSSGELALYAEGPGIWYREGTLVGGNGPVYVVEEHGTNFVKRHIPNACTFNAYGFNWNAIHHPGATVLQQLSTGQALNTWCS